MSSNRTLTSVAFIDDNPLTNQYHKLLWKDYKFADEVLFFDSANAALEALDKVDDKYAFPELIFVDINMPEMDGHELVKQLKEMDGYNENRTVLVYLTSSKDMRDVVKADENEVISYYWKPLTKDMLKEALKEHFDIDLVIERNS